MPKVVCALYHCSDFYDAETDQGWTDFAIIERIGRLTDAVEVVGAHIAGRDDLDAGPHFFLAPEYAFGRSPITRTKMMSLVTKCQEITRARPNILLVPGTAMVAKPNGNKAGNLCVGFHGSAIKFNFSKKLGVGEIIASETDREFEAGSGVGTCTIDGVSIACQICKDAEFGVGSPDIGAPDVHIVVAQGMDNSKSRDDAKKYKLIADATGGRGVFRKSGHFEPVAARDPALTSRGVKIDLYDLDL